MKVCMDRYFYSIKEYTNGIRFIHLSGNIYCNDACETEENFRIAEWTSLYLNIEEAKEMFESDTFYEYVNERVNYLGDITEDEAQKICAEYFGGKPGTQLHIYDITKDTPCGDYWFE